ncbi:MAG: phycobilisome rod-core linker polypeptide [Prochlorococcus sp.]|nr:phycobilisome rod-core linker polypeptide [Prochlorococcaceae cyanobacterium Fu_MAG_50]
MAIPVLDYPLEAQNSRVSNLAGNQHENDLPYSGSAAAGGEATVNGIDGLIERAYQQIFFHAMSCDRDRFLESQLRSGSITVRDFIRGLLLSKRFVEGYFQCSSNYRMVDQVFGRALGRPVHGDMERRSWAIVIGEQGYQAFIDAILNSEEYIRVFGNDRVPQQRSRLLPGQSCGERPLYQSFPRYAEDWRDSLQLRAPARVHSQLQLTTASSWVNGQPPRLVVNLWLGLALLGGIGILSLLLLLIGDMLSTKAVF